MALPSVFLHAGSPVTATSLVIEHWARSRTMAKGAVKEKAPATKAATARTKVVADEEGLGTEVRESRPSELGQPELLTAHIWPAESLVCH
jgi:hypothetical protein